MAAELIQEINDTNKLLSTLDEAGRALALKVKMHNMLGDSVLSPTQATSVLETIKVGPWSEQDVAALTQEVLSLLKPGQRGNKYRPQHMKKFASFLSRVKHDQIKSGGLPFEKALEVSAQQLIDLECFTPSEKTCGHVVQCCIELGGWGGKFNAKDKLDKVTSLKEWVKMKLGVGSHISTYWVLSK